VSIEITNGKGMNNFILKLPHRFLTGILIVVGLGYGQMVIAQSPGMNWKGKPVVVGLDIGQTIPSFVGGKEYPIQNFVVIEPVVGFNTSERKWTMLTAGYIQGRTFEMNNLAVPQIDLKGMYSRLCFETFNNKAKFIRVGYGPVVSLYSLKGSYQFEGPVFGNYEGNFKYPINLFFGFHGSLAFDTPIGKRLRVRLSGQCTTGLKLGGELRSSYIPGVGLSHSPGVFAIGINGGLHLFYTLR
jgi:hypothetical protein